MNPINLKIGSSNEVTYTGVVKDLRRVENNDSLVKKWTNSVIKGVPFPVGKERYVFVIRDTSHGVSKGYRAIVYGWQVGEKLSEGEICYLTGTTDKKGVIVGKRLYDPTSDLHIEADRVFPSVMTRSASLMSLLVIVYLIYALSHIQYTTFSIMGSQTSDILSIVVLFVLAVVCLRNRNRIVKMIGWVLLAMAVYTLYPPIVIMIIAFFIIKKVLFR